jgi:hypothetical protein
MLEAVEMTDLLVTGGQLGHFLPARPVGLTGVCSGMLKKRRRNPTK